MTERRNVWIHFCRKYQKIMSKSEMELHGCFKGKRVCDKLQRLPGTAPAH